MKVNGTVKSDDLHPHHSNNEEVYFHKVNTELLRRIQERRDREKKEAADAAQSVDEASLDEAA